MLAFIIGFYLIMISQKSFAKEIPQEDLKCYEVSEDLMVTDSRPIKEVHTVIAPLKLQRTKSPELYDEARLGNDDLGYFIIRGDFNKIKGETCAYCTDDMIVIIEPSEKELSDEIYDIGFNKDFYILQGQKKDTLITIGFRDVLPADRNKIKEMFNDILNSYIEPEEHEEQKQEIVVNELYSGEKIYAFEKGEYIIQEMDYVLPEIAKKANEGCFEIKVPEKMAVIEKHIGNHYEYDVINKKGDKTYHIQSKTYAKINNIEALILSIKEERGL